MDKIKTFIELEKEIKKIHNIVTPKSLQYLYSVLDLEQSIMYNSALNKANIDSVKNLSIFNDLAIYNIYNIALKFINYSNKKYKICGDMNRETIIFLTSSQPVFKLECNKGIKIYLYNGNLYEKQAIKQERQFVKNGILLMNHIDEKQFKIIKKENEKLKVKKLGCIDIIIK